MDALRGFLFLFLISVLLSCSCVCATTVTISVYEHGVNLTPVSQAAVYADNSPVGKTDTTGSLEFSHPGGSEIELKISKLGYDDWTGVLGGNETSFPVELARKNLSYTAIVLDSDTLNPIPGARVVLTAHEATKNATTDSNGSATFQVQANEPFGLEIRAENYQPRIESIEMGIEPKTSQFWLYPDERFVVILRDEEGEPVADADVYFDGNLAGTSDARGATTIDLPRGKVYTVKVKKDGYQDYHGQQVIGQDSALITISLEKIPYTMIVSVFDEADIPVSGALVAIDGADEGLTNQYGSLQLQNIRYGIYTITVKHPGYLTASKDVKVTSQGGDLVVVLDYERIPVILVTEEKGGKAVPEVLISLDGQMVGQTDNDGRLETKLRSNLDETINGTKDGYLPASINIRLNSSQNKTTVSLAMEPSLDLYFVAGVLGLVVIITAGFVILLSRKNKNRGSGRKGL